MPFQHCRQALILVIYYDKTKLLSAVKNLTPTISITKVETIFNNGENVFTLQGTKYKITFTSCLDHVALSSDRFRNKVVYNTAPSSSMSMTVNLYKGRKMYIKSTW